MNDGQGDSINRDSEAGGEAVTMPIAAEEDIARSRVSAAVRYAQRKERAALAASKSNSILRTGSIASTSASTSRPSNTNNTLGGMERARVGGSSTDTSSNVAGVFKLAFASVAESAQGKSKGRNRFPSLNQSGRPPALHEQEALDEQEENGEEQEDEEAGEEESMMEDSMIQQSINGALKASDKRKVNLLWLELVSFSLIVLYSFNAIQKRSTMDNTLDTLAESTDSRNSATKRTRREGDIDSNRSSS